jgi:hypothetical protein
MQILNGKNFKKAYEHFLISEMMMKEKECNKQWTTTLDNFKAGDFAY